MVQLPDVTSREAKPSFARRHKKKLIALLLLLTLPLALHWAILLGTRIEAPSFAAQSGEVIEQGPIRRLGPAYAHKRGNVTEVRLVGSPEAIGHQHAKLLYSQMVSSEQELYDLFEQLVPNAVLRTVIFDVARVLHHGVEANMSDARLREMAAQASAFSPDPFADRFPTFQRYVYLNSLYDIALGFEHSPMLGCSSFVTTGDKSVGGHTLLARNFDFELGGVYDAGKVVFLVHEDGQIPFASVAWPGLVGVLSGMNAEGLAVVVHGGRARETSNQGEPLVHTTRALLSQTRTLDEALTLLETRAAMVSHILVIADATGAAASVERAPGVRPHARLIEGGLLGVTNHFEGPLADDPKNQSIRQNTSTLPRRARLDELLAPADLKMDAARAVEVLRDRRGPDNGNLPLGHRSSLDALIATHAVVMDTTDRTLWVSEGPHLLGRFIRFDLKRLLAADYEPEHDNELISLPADPLLLGGFAEWQAAGSKHPGAQ